MNAAQSAIYAHSEHSTQAAAEKVAADLPGALVRFHKRRNVWDVLTPGGDEDGCKVISFNALPEPTAEEVAAVTAEIAAAAAAAANDDAWLDGEPELPKPHPFRVIEAEEFAGGEFVEPEWQAEGWVPRYGTGLDTGGSGTLKTFDVLHRATCIHNGLPYYGIPTVKGRAVIVVAEASSNFKFRMRALAQHLGLKLSQMPAVIIAAPNLFKPEQIKELILQLKILGATFVVIDTKWRCSLGANEDSASDNAVVYGSAEAIARHVGCFVTLVSHTGKAGVERGVRGSSSQYAAVDMEIMHEREGDLVTLTTTKCKDGPDGLVLTVKPLVVELGVSKRTGKPFGSLVLEHTESTPPAKQKPRKRPKGNDLLVLKCMEEKFQADAPTIEELFDELGEQIECPRPGRRNEYLRKSVARLADTEVNKWLWRHSGDRVALTGTIPGGKDEDF